MINPQDQICICTYQKRCEHISLTLGLDNRPYAWCNHPDGQQAIENLERCPFDELLSSQNTL